MFFDRQQQRGNKKPDLLRQRGLAYQFLGNDKKAILDYSAALKANPDAPDILLRRGQIYARTGKHAEAIEDFSKIIQAEPKNHAARYCRAISCAAEQKYEEAHSDVIKAIKLDAKQPSYHILLGELLQRTGDTSRVLVAYNRAILEDPTDAATYRRRGAVHSQAQNYLNAISDFTHSLELSPTQIEVLVQRGNAYLKANQLGLAMEDFELALTHNDKLAKALSLIHISEPTRPY